MWPDTLEDGIVVSRTTNITSIAYEGGQRRRKLCEKQRITVTVAISCSDKAVSLERLRNAAA
jgi:hypothetical protein